MLHSRQPCFVWCWLFAGLLLAMGWPGFVRAAGLEDFEAGSFEHQGRKLLYRLLKPQDYDPQQKYPLVLFLHGAGERGDDNQAQLKHVVRIFVSEENRGKYACFVLAPQCPAGEKWVDVNWGAAKHTQPAEPAAAMDLALRLIERLMAQYAIDRQRVYVMGLSMGGYGTWDAIARRPDLFAAAVPMCGGGDEHSAKRIASLPIWNFHGAQDLAVPVSRSRNMIAALREAGAAPRYTEYPDCGHNCWDRAVAEPELLPWLFAQRRQEQ